MTDSSQSTAGSAAPRARWSGRLWRWLRTIAVAYLLVLLGMMMLEDSLIYFPSKYPDGDWRPAGLIWQDANFTAKDGTRLHGWYVAHDQPRAVVLFAHGNAGNLSHRADLLRVLHNRLNVSVMAFDYRGFGRSEGTPTEAGVYQDARAARAWLAQRASVAEQDIVLVGESLGGAVVVELAAADGARGLVLENTFARLPEVAAFHYPLLPVKLLMRSQFDSVTKIGRYHGPLLQVHGDADTIIPFKFAQRLFDAAHEPKQFVVIPGGDHNDPRQPAFYAALDRFFQQLPAIKTSR